MTQYYFACYPWDIEEEGLEETMARMAGEIGVDAVSVAVVHHDVHELRPRGGEGKKVVVRAAAVHFQPTTALYAETPIKPNVASGLKSGDPLVRIVRAAEHERLGIRLDLSACWNPVIAQRYPMAACENIFGEKNGRWLCPSNPAVRAYITALAEDLAARCPSATVELSNADFGDGAGLGRFLDQGVQPTEVERVLWSWCFCPSCRQRAVDAGVDARSAGRAVRHRLESMLEMRLGREEPDFDALLANDRDLAAYQSMRIESVCSLARMVRSRVRGRLVVEVSAPVSSSGANIQCLRGCCDGLAFQAGSARQDPLAERVNAPGGLRDAGGPEKVDLLHACCPPSVVDGDSLVRAVHEAAAGGFAGVGFLNFGLAPNACLEWVRRAIRYARRERG